MIGLAKECVGDPAAQYVLLDSARKMFIGAEDVRLAVKTVKSMSEQFRIDADDVYNTTFEDLADANLLPEVRDQLAVAILQRVDATLAANKFAAAERYSVLATKVAARTRDIELRKRIAEHRAEIQRLKVLLKAVEEARATLATDANDAAANLILGKYLCFVRNEWEQGLAHVLKSGNPDYIAAAKADAAVTADSQDSTIAAADAWHKLAEAIKKDDKDAANGALGRAKGYYQDALITATGLEKLRLENRLAEMPEATVASRATNKAANKPATNSAISSAITAPRAKVAAGRIPAAKEIEVTLVCEVLRGKSAPKGLVPEAKAFDAPLGSGRRGANGIVLRADDSWKKQGTEWKFTYERSRSAWGVHIAHPYQNGQIVVLLNPKVITVMAGGNWGDFGWLPVGPHKLPVEHTPESKTLLPIVDSTPYEVVSQLTSDGRYGLFLNKQLIAFTVVPAAFPLDLDVPPRGAPPKLIAPKFTGGDMPRKLIPGEALLIVGPLDTGVNILSNVEFGPISVATPASTTSAIGAKVTKP
jgi:hypothetical protein